MLLMARPVIAVGRGSRPGQRDIYRAACKERSSGPRGGCLGLRCVCACGWNSEGATCVLSASFCLWKTRHAVPPGVSYMGRYGSYSKHISFRATL